jgi:hypothetical protein
MSSTTVNPVEKTSYRSAVTFLEDVPLSSELTSDKHTKTVIEFDNFEDVKPFIRKDLQRQKLINMTSYEHKLPLTVSMRYLMSDIIESLGDLTNEIKEVYEIKGIANSLKLSDVLDVFEESVRVTYLGDIETEANVSDDDGNGTIV